MSDLKNYILGLKAPEATSTYSPISNREIYEEVRENLEVGNYPIINEVFHPSHNYKAFTAVITVKTNSPELQKFGVGANIYVRNSYNKLFTASAHLEYSMLVCNNGLFTMKDIGGVSRVHKGKDAFAIFQTALYEKLKMLEHQNTDVLKIIDIFRETMLNKEQLDTLIGNLAWSMSPTIFSKFLNELKTNVNFNIEYFGLTLWNVFNCYTEAIKGINETKLGYDGMTKFIHYRSQFTNAEFKVL